MIDDRQNMSANVYCEVVQYSENVMHENTRETENLLKSRIMLRFLLYSDIHHRLNNGKCRIIVGPINVSNWQRTVM